MTQDRPTAALCLHTLEGFTFKTKHLATDVLFYFYSQARHLTLLWNKYGTGYFMLKLFKKTNNRGMMENYPPYVRFLTSPNKIQLSSALHMIRILGETCLLSAPFIIWLKHFYLSLFYLVLDEEKTQVSESSAAHRALTQWVESKWFSHIP